MDLQRLICRFGSVFVVVSMSACATYHEPQTGPMLLIKNIQSFEVDIEIDVKDAGELSAKSTRIIRVTPEMHKITAENYFFLPLLVFWKWNFKTAFWNIDGTTWKDENKEDDFILTLDKYNERKG